MRESGKSGGATTDRLPVYRAVVNDIFICISSVVSGEKCVCDRKRHTLSTSVVGIGLSLSLSLLFRRLSLPYFFPSLSSLFSLSPSASILKPISHNAIFRASKLARKIASCEVGFTESPTYNALYPSPLSSAFFLV